MTDNFRKFRKLDIVAIIMLVFLWSIIVYLVNLRDNYSAFMISLFVTAMFIAFTGFLIRKTGTVILFCLLIALVSVRINDFLGLEWNNILALGVAGIVFEAFFLLLSLEIKNIPFDVVLGTGFAVASVPFSMLFLVEERVAGIIYSAWNFALTAFIIGIIGAFVIFLVWHHVKNLKPVIKFEYHV